MAVNSIQMPINVKLNQNESMPGSYGRYYLEAATAEVLTTEGLVNHITHHNCAVGTEAIAAVIKKLGECIPELVAQGQPVKIDPSAERRPERPDFEVVPEDAGAARGEPGVPRQGGGPDA